MVKTSHVTCNTQSKYLIAVSFQEQCHKQILEPHGYCRLNFATANQCSSFQSRIGLLLWSLFMTSAQGISKFVDLKKKISVQLANTFCMLNKQGVCLFRLIFSHFGTHLSTSKFPVNFIQIHTYLLNVFTYLSQCQTKLAS